MISISTPSAPTSLQSGLSDRNGNYVVNFFSSQPALNYGFERQDYPWQLPPDHPACVATLEEMKNVMRFWLDMGCDSFRVDMAYSLVKNDDNRTGIKRLWQNVRRTGIYLDAIAEAKKLITDRPVFAGVIGPFSLAGRLVDVTEAMTTRYSWSERRRGRQAPIRPHRAARPKRAPPRASPCTFRRYRFRRTAWGYGFRAWKRGVPDSSPVPPRTQPSFHPSEP